MGHKARQNDVKWIRALVGGRGRLMGYERDMDGEKDECDQNTDMKLSRKKINKNRCAIKKSYKTNFSSK